MDFSYCDLDAVFADSWPTNGDRSSHGAKGRAEIEKPDTSIRAEAGAPDIPAAVGKMILWSYALMMASLLLFFGTSVEAAMMAIICALYTAIYLGVPAALLVVERRSGGRTLDDFLARGLTTATGPIACAEALAQILLIPAAITAEIVIIGSAAALIL